VNQFDRPVSFFCAPEKATRTNQFPLIILLSFFHGTEVGKKSESIRNTTEFLSWGRWAPGANQFVILLNFLHGTEVDTKI
jgi:hypothetical protein